MWTHLGFSSWRPQLRLSRQMLGYATRAYRTTTLRQHSCGTGSLLRVTHEFIGLGPDRTKPSPAYRLRAGFDHTG